MKKRKQKTNRIVVYSPTSRGRRIGLAQEKLSSNTIQLYSISFSIKKEKYEGKYTNFTSLFLYCSVVLVI